jgi:hypothetical protein
VSLQAKHRFSAKVRLALTFPRATAPILLSLGAIYMVFRKHSMSNSNGVDPMQLRQLRAMAENLCTQANHHSENQNYLVAYGLYGRALSVAQKIPRSEHDENVLVARIRTDQQAVFEMLRSEESGLKKTPLEKAQKVGR